MTESSARSMAGIALIAAPSTLGLRPPSPGQEPGTWRGPAVGPSAVAGMDLVLATGRGEALMTAWDGGPAPLVRDEWVVQIGERESRDPNWSWPDVQQTAITQIDVFWAREQGMDAVLRRACEALDRAPHVPFWTHLDVDVLDQMVMPAVDSPGSPGLDYGEVAALLRGLLASPRCLGLNVTIFNPDLDPVGVYAPRLARMLRDGIVPALAARKREA